jgi:hypothetical protein
MRRYNGTFRGKSSQALQTARKAVKKVEKEQGVKVENTLTLNEVMFTLSASECLYCGRETEEHERTLDHLKPMKDGGENSFHNVCMACMECNRLKGDTPLMLHFIREVDSDDAFRLVEQIATRKGVHFIEVFEELTTEIKRYYAKKVEKARRDLKGNELLQ